MVFAAPGLLTTVLVGTIPVFWKICWMSRAMTSGEPPGAEPTTSSTVLVGFHCAIAGDANDNSTAMTAASASMFPSSGLFERGWTILTDSALDNRWWVTLRSTHPTHSKLCLY